jgi:DNA-binding MarR family transcriptional regulator
MQMQQHDRRKWRPTNKDPRERAWVALQYFGSALLERVEYELKAAGFPGVEHYDVLWGLQREGPMRQRDLADHTLQARYSISRLVDRMEADGLVERRDCPNDARGQMVHPTAAGLKLRKQMWAVYGKAIQQAMGPLSEKEAAMLATLMAKLA